MNEENNATLNAQPIHRGAFVKFAQRPENYETKITIAVSIISIFATGNLLLSFTDDISNSL